MALDKKSEIGCCRNKNNSPSVRSESPFPDVLARLATKHPHDLTKVHDDGSTEPTLSPHDLFSLKRLVISGRIRQLHQNAWLYRIERRRRLLFSEAPVHDHPVGRAFGHDRGEAEKIIGLEFYWTQDYPIWLRRGLDLDINKKRCCCCSPTQHAEATNS